LEHTFESYGVEKGTTDNLMDYVEASHLTCWQWDRIHNPGIVWSFLDKDDEAMFSLSMIWLGDVLNGWAADPYEKIVEDDEYLLNHIDSRYSDDYNGKLPKNVTLKGYTHWKVNDENFL
jgi:hypothetical protein